MLEKLVPFIFKLAHLLLECDKNHWSVSIPVCAVESSASIVACPVLVFVVSLPNSRKFNFFFYADHAFREIRGLHILLLENAGNFVVWDICQWLFKKRFQPSATFNVSRRVYLGQSLISHAAVKLPEKLGIGLFLHVELLLQALDFSCLFGEVSFENF